MVRKLLVISQSNLRVCDQNISVCFLLFAHYNFLFSFLFSIYFQWRNQGWLKLLQIYNPLRDGQTPSIIIFLLVSTEILKMWTDYQYDELEATQPLPSCLPCVYCWSKCELNTHDLFELGDRMCVFCAEISSHVYNKKTESWLWTTPSYIVC